MKYLIVILFVFLDINMSYSQQDSIFRLDEVVVSDSRLLEFSNGVKLVVITDSTLQRVSGGLTNALRYNSSIYFKENGNGMLSSPSFRGTGASQTAVIWNGINVNSQLNGQTDFNTILPQNYDKISIRSGGGSTQYGTGAIGGSIHLENTLNFVEDWINVLNLGYGSFDTKNFNYKTKYGSDKFAVNIGLGHVSSKNDYKYLGTDRRNENGEFNNNSLDIGVGLFLSSENLIKLQHSAFIGDRNFSGTLTAPSNSKYKDVNSKSLLEWISFKNKKVQRVKAAHLYEEYTYFANKDSDIFSIGKAKTFLLNYDLKYKVNNIVLNGLLDYNNINGEGSSITDVTRNLFASTFLFSHLVSKKFTYGINLRKDWVTDYFSPFVYALSGKYQFTSNYRMTLNTSKNFRIPTFNDLYWETGGNTNLEPETSYQIEIGQVYTKAGIKAELYSFYIANNNLIQWRPSSTSGIWSPSNIKSVYQYGIESSLSFQKKIKNNLIGANVNYAFTKAIDEETGYQLLYVPKHKVTTTVNYTFKKISIALQTLYNSLVYTTTDESQEVDAYFIGNTTLEYEFKDVFKSNVVLALSVNNILNTNYQNVAFRPMPNRNFKLQLNFKF